MTNDMKNIRDAAQFLADRLATYERDLSNDAGQMCADFLGHVAPAAAVLRIVLRAPQPAPAPAVPVEVGLRSHLIALMDEMKGRNLTTSKAYADAGCALRAQQPAPQVKALADAAKALVEFHNGPTDTKRPDVFQRRMRSLDAALSALSGEAQR